MNYQDEEENKQGESQLVTSPLASEGAGDGLAQQSREPQAQSSKDLRVRISTANFGEEATLEEQRESRSKQVRESLPGNKKAVTNLTSLNVSTNAGSNSRPGSALKSRPGKAHQYAILKQMRPMSANLTPALAYKRQAAEQQIRKGTQTPAKKNTPLIQQRKAAAAGKTTLNQGNGVSPFNNSYSNYTPGIGSTNKRPSYNTNAAVTFTINQSEQKRSAAYRSLNSSSANKKGKKQGATRRLFNESSASSFLAPGTYNPKIEPVRQRSPNALILPEGAHSGSNQNNLGPGEYKSLDDFGRDARAVSILPEHQHPDSRATVPGPGSYQPNFSPVEEALKNTRISPSRGSQNRDDANPGPGSYDYTLKNIGKDCIGYSMLQTERKSSSSPNPGPGTYDPEIKPTRERSPEYSFQGPHRVSGVNSFTGTGPQLGPGFYKLKDYLGKSGLKYSIKPGQEPNRLSNVPGPGFYNPNDSVIKDKVKSIKFIQTSKSASKMDSNPAPGSYHVERSFGQDAPKYSMYPKSKSRLEISPGPGRYNPDHERVRPKSSAWRFSPTRQSRDVSRNPLSPGPGQYATLDTFGRHGPKLSIGGKTSTRNPDQVPGPGYYQPNLTVVKETTKKAAIGRSTRGDLLAKDRKAMPGPGHYESPEKFGKDGVKVSIHERIKQISRNLNPGPADYNPHDTVVRMSSPKYKLGQATERTNFIRKELVPGPGYYDQRSKLGLESPQYSIAAKRDAGPLNQNPGPANYSVNDSLVREQSPNQSFPRAERGASNLDPQQPGPGQYDESKRDQLKYQHLSYTIPQGERMSPLHRDRRLNPGPGNYDGQVPFGRDGIHYSMRQRSPNGLSEDQPGPGEYYNDKSLIGGPDSIKYTMGEKRDGRPGDGNLGPAYYHADDGLTYDRAPAAFFSGSPQGSPYPREDQPGPGAYNEGPGKDSRFQNISYRFPEGERMSPMSRDQRLNPGPAAYQTAPEGFFGRDGIKYTIGERSPSKAGESNPGPGHYTPFKSFIDLKALLGKINPLVQHLGVRATPGPADYNPRDSFIRERSPEYKMHRSSSQGRLSQVGRDALLSPGPGHYNFKRSLIGDAISYTIGQKRDAFGQPNNPGPGTYNPDENFVRESSPAYKVPQTERGGNVPLDVAQAPGPGTYDGKYDQKYRDIKYSFSQLQRPDQVTRDQRYFPGPGNYTERLDVDFGREAPKYTMGAKPELGSADDVPGPGHYNDPKSFTQINAPLGFINPDNGTGPSGPNNPGPSHYYPDDRFTQGAAPAFTFSGGPEKGLNPNPGHNLGPGQYDHVPLIGGDGSISYTIGQRRDLNPGTEQPGSAHYSPLIDIIQQQAPNYTIGGVAPRMSDVPRDLASNPGPGSYSQPTLIGGSDGIFYTIGEKREGGPSNQNPGPAQYHPSYLLAHPNGPAYTISPSEKPTDFSLDSNVQLGPGKYNPIDNSYPNIKYSFSQGERPNTVSRDQRTFPGPGVYATPSLLGLDSPAYTIGLRHDAGQHDDFPGPGSYNHAKSMVELLNGAPLGVIHPVHSADPSLPYVPGPGEYTPGDLSITKDSSPAPTFAKTQRDFLNNSDPDAANLGPGTYDPALQKTSISFTIGLKHPDQKDNNYPGPGAYTTSHTQIDTRSPQYDFTRSPERLGGDFSRNVSLGPGTYDPKEQFLSNNPTSATHSFSKMERDYPPTVSDQLGPGFYRIPVKFGEEKLYAMPVVNPDFKYV